MMIFAQYCKVQNFPFPWDMPNERSDGQGNIWVVHVRDSHFIVQKHVNRVRIKAAEVEIQSIRASWAKTLKTVRNRQYELDQKMLMKAPPSEISQAQEALMHAQDDRDQIKERFDMCRELMLAGTTEVFRFPLIALDKLVFGDVPITMEKGPGPRLDVPALQIQEEIDDDE